MKKVLIICQKIAEEQTGGVQTRIINYARNLPKYGVDPKFLSIANYEKAEKSRYRGATFYKFPCQGTLKIISFIIKNRKGFDLIHFLEGITGRQQFILLVLGKILKKPTLVSLYGGEIFDIFKKNKFIDQLKIKYIQKSAAKIIVNSKATAKFIPKEYLKKVFIVYPGVNSEYLQYISQDSHNKKTGFNLLFAGRLIRRKGLDDIIRALKIVQKEYPKTNLTVAGDGPNLASYKKLALNLNLKNKVNFLGEVKEIKEMAQLYLNCDVFLMTPKLVDNPPGGYESFGCVYLEANLFKKPVIGTKHFGVKEAVVDKKTGILVEENNSEEIAKAIIKLLADANLRIRLGEKGQQRTRNNFMDINSTQQLANVYL